MLVGKISFVKLQASSLKSHAVASLQCGVCLVGTNYTAYSDADVDRGKLEGVMITQK